MKHRRFRKDISKEGLLRAIREEFASIPGAEEVARKFSLVDYLMSSLAIFVFKCSSLLQFDRLVRTGPLKANLKNLFGVENPMCDSAIRKKLDHVEPSKLRGAFKKFFRIVQRGKLLESFRVFDGYYLLPADGTEVHDSKSIHCEHCCERKRRDGKTEWYHQLVVGVICHPKRSQVIPLMPEPIERSDGQGKNDSESAAAKRFFAHFREDHPRMRCIVLQDGLYSNGPHIRMLKEHDLRYIIVARAGDHRHLFEILDTDPNVRTMKTTDEKGVVHEFRYVENVSLNASNPDERVNAVDYVETQKDKKIVKGKKEDKVVRYTWVTDLPVNQDTVMDIMRAGRKRWMIENETIKTLKKDGYHFEHNYGHGNKYLFNVFTSLMMLAFGIDQVEALDCKVYRAAVKARINARVLREAIRVYIHDIVFTDWMSLYLFFIDGGVRGRGSPDEQRGCA